MTVETSARRMLRIAWTVSGLFVAGAAVRFAQGFTPQKLMAGPIGDEVLWIAYLALPLVASVLISIPLLRLFFRILGRPVPIRSGERRLRLDSIEADAFCDRAMAELMRDGYVVERDHPLPDGGWRRSARNFFPGHHNVDFECSGPVLWIRFWYHSNIDVDTGERQRLEWLLSCIADGKPLNHPPRQLDHPGALFFVWTLINAAMAGAIHFAPSVILETHVAGLVFSTLGILLYSAALSLAAYFSLGRRLSGKRIAIASLILSGCAMFFLLSRPPA